MPHVICFANMKGGVGKTTLCVNLGFALFSRQKKVLIVDNDPQFNATTALLEPQNYLKYCINTGAKYRTIHDIYEKPPRIAGGNVDKGWQEYFIPRWFMGDKKAARLDLLASRIDLYETLRNPSQKEYLLDKFLANRAQDYDYVLIDCPPTPSVLTLSAFSGQSLHSESLSLRTTSPRSDFHSSLERSSISRATSVTGTTFARWDWCSPRFREA